MRRTAGKVAGVVRLLILDDGETAGKTDGRELNT